MEFTGNASVDGAVFTLMSRIVDNTGFSNGNTELIFHEKERILDFRFTIQRQRPRCALVSN